MDDHPLLLRVSAAARRWGPALALIGAALVLLAATPTTTRPGAGAAPAPGQSVTLTAASPLEWTLTTSEPRLTRLRVWLAPPVPLTGQLSAALSDVALPALALARADASLGAAGPGGALDLSFEPLRAGSSPHVPTMTLLVRLYYEGNADTRVVLLAAEGGVAAFEPAYQVRPFDRLWPISAFAAGRPGLLGWPPLYALLAYAFLVALLRVALLVLRPSYADG